MEALTGFILPIIASVITGDWLIILASGWTGRDQKKTTSTATKKTEIRPSVFF